MFVFLWRIFWLRRAIRTVQAIRRNPRGLRDRGLLTDLLFLVLTRGRRGRGLRMLRRW